MLSCIVLLVVLRRYVEVASVARFAVILMVRYNLEADVRVQRIITKQQR